MRRGRHILAQRAISPRKAEQIPEESSDLSVYVAEFTEGVGRMIWKIYECMSNEHTRCEMCEMCEQKRPTTAVTAQTMPGSFDTKFIEVQMCDECQREYQGTLAQIWRVVGGRG